MTAKSTHTQQWPTTEISKRGSRHEYVVSGRLCVCVYGVFTRSTLEKWQNPQSTKNERLQFYWPPVSLLFVDENETTKPSTRSRTKETVFSSFPRSRVVRSSTDHDHGKRNCKRTEYRKGHILKSKQNTKYYYIIVVNGIGISSVCTRTVAHNVHDPRSGYCCLARMCHVM